MVITRVKSSAEINPSSRQERMAWMDLLRGAASLLVTLLHATTLVRDFGIKPSVPFLAFNNALGPVRMPLLMMLSGMLLARSLNKPFAEYFVKKCSSLLYPFLLWTLVIGVFIRPDDVDDRSLWMGASYLWFLLFLFTFYCVALLVRRVPTYVMILIAAVSSFASPENSMFYERYFFLMAMFYVGKLLTDYPNIIIATMGRLGVVITGITIVILVIVASNLRMMKYDIEWVPLIVPGTLFLFWLAYIAKDNRGLGWLAMIGRNSIVTYVLHWPIIWIVVSGLTGEGYTSPTLLSALALLIALLACLIASFARERYNLFDWLYKLPKPVEATAIGVINRIIYCPGKLFQ